MYNESADYQYEVSPVSCISSYILLIHWQQPKVKHGPGSGSHDDHGVPRQPIASSTTTRMLRISQRREHRPVQQPFPPQQMKKNIVLHQLTYIVQIRSMNWNRKTVQTTALPGSEAIVSMIGMTAPVRLRRPLFQSVYATVLLICGSTTTHHDQKRQNVAANQRYISEVCTSLLCYHSADVSLASDHASKVHQRNPVKSPSDATRNRRRLIVISAQLFQKKRRLPLRHWR